jgi:hypothetical protein
VPIFSFAYATRQYCLSRSSSAATIAIAFALGDHGENTASGHNFLER